MILPWDMYAFLFPLISKDRKLPEDPSESNSEKPWTSLRQVAFLRGRGHFADNQPHSVLGEKLLAVHCMLFCVCLHCVAGNQRKAVGHRLSQADLKDEARLCYKSFCQAELSLSSVPLSQSYKGIVLTSGSFQGTWQWFKLAFSFSCTQCFTEYCCCGWALLGLVPRALPHRATAQEKNHGGKRPLTTTPPKMDQQLPSVLIISYIHYLCRQLINKKFLFFCLWDSISLCILDSISLCILAGLEPSGIHLLPLTLKACSTIPGQYTSA